MRFVQVVFGTLQQTLKGKFSEVEQKIEKVKDDTSKVSESVTKYSSEYKRDNQELVSKFMSEVYGSVDGVYGLIEKNASLFRQTAASIKAQVSQVDRLNTSRIASLEIRADGISADVSANYNSLHQDITTVDIKADGIKSTVTRIDGDLTTAKSTITQQANLISLRVEKGKVISEINQTAETIKIAASKLELDGYATFTSLSTAGQTTINGDNITTGSLDCSKITVTNLSADSIKAGGTITGNKFTNNAITIDDSDVIIKSASGFLKCIVNGYTRNLIGYSGNNIYVGSDIFEANAHLYMGQRYIDIGNSNFNTDIKFLGKLGFYGVTPAQQQSVYRVYPASVTLSGLASRFNELCTALDTIGIISSNYQS
jgi:uncharacterized UPF0146 family protein